MTEAAYFFSKEAEVILAPYVQHLVGAERPPQISSPLLPEPWDYDFEGLLIDLKLACKARVYGRISDRTLADIRASLGKGVMVALLVPPKIYLLFPSLRVLPHSSTPAILSKTRLRMRLWTKRIRFTRAARPQKDRASIR
jgi:hypothetical protein